jgi:hypothetical protein
VLPNEDTLPDGIFAFEVGKYPRWTRKGKIWYFWQAAGVLDGRSSDCRVGFVMDHFPFVL